MKPQKKRSLQAVHKLRQQETFLGREKQEVFFQQNLTLDEEYRIFIFNIFGQGGVGKTSLAHRFRQLAESASATIGWSDDAQKDVPAVMDKIAKQFEKQGHELKNFSKTYHIYLQRCQELTAAPDAPPGFADFIGGLTRAGVRIGRHTPAGALFEFVDEDTLAKGVNSLTSNFVMHLKRKLSDEEARLVQKPIEELTPLFLEDLWEVSQRHLIALFFDTFEYTERYLNNWLIDCLDEHYGEIPSNIILTIAGRNKLDANQWAAYDDILTRISLEPFTQEDTRKYLGRKGIVDEQVIQVIWHLSKGLPLLVATLALGHPNDPHQVGDPSGTAVDRFLKWENDVGRRQVMIDAALPRRLNRDILSVLVNEQDAENLFSWLRELPFVQEHTIGWTYHGVVRPQMIRYKRIESPREWSNLHNRLASYYKKCRDDLELDEEKGMHNPTWQDLALEEIYHCLCQAPHKHLSLALNGFLAGLSIQGTYALRWAETIQEAGEDADSNILQDWGKKLIKVLKDYREKRYQEAAEIFSELLKVSDIEKRWHQVALSFRASCYVSVEKELEALADANELIEANPNDSWLFLLRAIVFLKLDRTNDFMRDIDRFSALSPDAAKELAEQLSKIITTEKGTYGIKPPIED